MISFQLRAIGTLARNPELCARGVATFARFCLVGQDEFTGCDDGEHSREAVASLWFFACGEIGTSIARQARKGDQLMVEARVVADNWSEKGERQSGHTFVVTGFRFGAKRGDNGPPVSSRCARPPATPQPDAAQAVADAVPQDMQEVAAGR